MSTSKICCIMDIEGFYSYTDKKFLVREIGWINYHDFKKVRYGVIRFDLSAYENPFQFNEGEVPPRLRTDIVFNQSTLTFLPDPNEPTESLDTLEQKIIEIYNGCRSGERDIVVFKGGDLERDILKNLSIPCMNLEDLGCPKYEKIKNMYDVVHCGHHLRVIPYTCAQAEVMAFRAWLVKKYDKRR